MRTFWNLPVVDLMPFGEVVERRPVLLVTSPPAWNAVADRLGGLNVACRVEVDSATTQAWDALLQNIGPQLPAVEAVYAVGGGLTADTAKYYAAQRRLPLVILPTALSVDAFFTAASGVRREGCVYYIETKPPERLILDLDVIANAPQAIRAAGITDVLSIATGCWDWKFAHEQGENPPGMEFIPWMYANAQSILAGALDCAEAAGAGDHQGLKALYDCLALEVQLCNQAGHARPEEGSEHYFAYCVENLTGHGLPHGDLVSAGILTIARLQGQETAPLERAIRACRIPLDRIPEPMMAQTLKELPAFCRKHHLPFGIAHTLR